jgi:hypothetical protein
MTIRFVKRENGLWLRFDLQLFAGNSWYVRDGAGGSNNGQDWTNAWEDMDDINWTSVARGDTIYIADGTYLGDTFDKDVSGSNYIYITKATIAEHGTETGWSNSYGDGQATLGPISFSTSYWILNGVSRTGLKTGHGIIIDNSSRTARAIYFSANVDYVTVKYCGIHSGSHEPAGYIDNIYAVSTGNSYITIQYCHIHDAPRVLVYIIGGDNWLIERNYFERNGGEGDIHAEGFAVNDSDNLVIRYNYFDRIRGTGYIATPDSGGSGMNSNWEIYGNIFANHDQAEWSYCSNGVITAINYQSTANWKIYNNSFVDLVGNDGICFWIEHAGVTHTNNVAYNNIWYSCNSVPFINCTHDYNWYYGATQSETHGQIGSGDPFVDWVNENYHLTAHTNTGLDLGSPYNIDMDDIVRSNWDRGAYEYGGLPAGVLSPNIYDVIKARESIEPRIASYAINFARVE